MQQYIRKLVYDDLNKTTALHVLKKLRKLNWEQDEVNLVSNTAFLLCLLFSWLMKERIDCRIIFCADF